MRDGNETPPPSPNEPFWATRAARSTTRNDIFWFIAWSPLLRLVTRAPRLLHGDPRPLARKGGSDGIPPRRRLRRSSTVSRPCVGAQKYRPTKVCDDTHVVAQQVRGIPGWPDPVLICDISHTSAATWHSQGQGHQCVAGAGKDGPDDIASLIDLVGYQGPLKVHR